MADNVNLNPNMQLQDPAAMAELPPSRINDKMQYGHVARDPKDTKVLSLYCFCGVIFCVRVG